MQIVKSNDGGSIIFDSSDFRAGLGPQGKFNSIQTLRQVASNGFVYLSRMDPFTEYGCLYPETQPTPTATNNNSLGGAVVAFEVVDNTIGYGIDTSGKIQSISYLSTPTISTAGGFPHTIAYAAGSTYVGQDCLLYRHNSGGTAPANSVVSLFYSAYNSNNWDVGAYVNLGTFDDDFMSSVPATPLDITSGDGDDATQRTAPHFLCIGADGVLYIGSGRYLHAYDGNVGNNGTFYSKVLTLPQGTQIMGMIKTQDKLLLNTNYYTTATGNASGEAIVYTWNYIDLDISQAIPLEDNYTSAIFLWKGVPTVITSGVIERNGKVKVKMISGTSTRKVADFDGTIPAQRGVVVVNGVVTMNAGGQIITVGDKYAGGEAVNFIAGLERTGVSGVLFYNSTNTCFTGSSYGDSFPCFNNLSNGKGPGQVKTFSVYPDFGVNKVGRIKGIFIEYAKPLAASGTNGDMSAVLTTDNASVSSTFIANVNTIALPLVKQYAQPLDGSFFPQFSSVALTLSWNAAGNGGESPGIARLWIDYLIEDVNPAP